jgi:hypothetical protein
VVRLPVSSSFVTCRPLAAPPRSAASYRCVVPCSALFVRVYSCCQ